MPENIFILFLTRGRGRGHAVPDMAIAREVLRTTTNVNIRFVSYATGAQTLRSFGHDVIDLKFAQDPPFLQVMIALSRLMHELRPDLVVAHEEFAALPAAQIFNIPCVFITDFFQDPNAMFMQALRYATEILFISEPGVFTEPPYVRERVRYVGSAVRSFEYNRDDRDRARRELGLPLDGIVVLCQPGSWTESTFPILSLVMSAWRLLPLEPKHLLWLAGTDYDFLVPYLRDEKGVTIIREDWQIDRLIVASDLVITKCNRLTVFETASLGIPSLCLSRGANWADDVAVAKLESNTLLDVQVVTPESLTNAILAIVSSNAPITPTEPRRWDGVRGSAQRLLEQIARLR